MANNSGRVTYKDIMDFQEKVFDELKEIRAELSTVRETGALDRGQVKSLLRRDTVGYVWDSINTLFSGAVIYFINFFNGG